MTYLSTKELAQKWDVSISLIVRLAKAGRIPGAKLFGKSWVFPSDSKKPVDKRKKSLSTDTPRNEFRFPLYLYLPYSGPEINRIFTEEEQALYRAELFFHQGNYAEAAAGLEQLYFDNPSHYVRYGILYYLCVGNIYLHNYAKSCRYYHEINSMYLKETAHTRELEFILYDLETYFAGNEQFLSRNLLAFPNTFPADMQGYLLLNSAYADLLRVLLNKDRVNPSPYQLICDYNLAEYSELCQVFMLMYTALLLHSQQLIPESEHYLLQACHIAEKNHLERDAAYLFVYYPELFRNVLEDEHSELLARLNELAEQYRSSFNGLLTYLKKTEVFQLLTPSDYRLISFIKDGATHKEIAAELHLSPATISKKFAVLYEKTGTHNKNELAKLCSDAIKAY